jgi:hypothetical protein
MWQSLSFGANYKAAYCMAVCPAGDDVIGPFLKDRKGFLEGVVQPLQKKSETVYVVPRYAAGVIRFGTDLLFKDRPPRSCTHN